MIPRMLILLTTDDKLFLIEDCFCFSFWAVVYSREEGRLELYQANARLVASNIP